MAKIAADKQLINEIGKRKSSIARIFVRARKGETGTIKINDRTLEDYFPRPSHRYMVVQPLNMTATLGTYDIQVNVHGGGVTGQASAIRHAISKAIQELDKTHRAVLKKAGLLTRDSRVVERKKAGLSGARKRFQFSKR